MQRLKLNLEKTEIELILTHLRLYAVISTTEKRGELQPLIRALEIAFANSEEVSE